MRGHRTRLVGAAAVGLLAVVLVGFIAPTLYAGHPPRCSWASNYGDFCVEWNDVLGRYNPPPAGIPADFSRPDPGRDAAVSSLAAIALVFGSTAGIAWAAMTATAAARRARANQAGAKPSHDIH